MHESSYERMREFVLKYLNPRKKLKILDVGSYDVGGNYKKLFDNPNWEYYGGDIASGPNVDTVFKKPYDWGLKPESFDVIISGQCLEHVEDTKEWIMQINKALKTGGLVCIIAPWIWREHKYPVDCWRILPDGMNFLLKKVCGFKILKIFIKENDCVGIAKKPHKPIKKIKKIITQIFKK
ncbi:TPA: class I SAM-dependent methyltransferase [Candidatus Woesearchaeota archaeon]|nr:class I SAM-dependent methyltransferase [Candidatus Woesearchaeota archaeon]HIH31568.1 class I SAM-dependent methyltransferase [Candidatus Woesearchaeota archaeon]HIH54274.1 class I SAM-dependent methyltransferase [Candidatus Woesearchaeota archaeon]HIJ02536.1 class I SAM-dependent methyltransferase [Candidatus Woesearchaeota archaeon]HIJ13418.1 class I SAM-dependent methyltransferase [Candidatus Woesearchaeota archaeon]